MQETTQLVSEHGPAVATGSGLTFAGVCVWVFWLRDRFIGPRISQKEFRTLKSQVEDLWRWKFDSMQANHTAIAYLQEGKTSEGIAILKLLDDQHSNHIRESHA